jgi:thioredoxin 1
LTLRDGNVVASGAISGAGDLQAHVDHLLGGAPLPGVSPAASADVEGVAAAQGVRELPVVTDASFTRDVLHSELPVLVDFWAAWCAPCRMVAPTVEKLAREEAARLRVAKLNVDENPVIAGQLGVTGIPTMIVFRGGQVVDRWTGAMPESSIRARLARLI